MSDEQKIGGAPERWRVGIKVPINVYAGDRPVCQCQTADDAKRIVKAVNVLNAVELVPRPKPKKRVLIHIQEQIIGTHIAASWAEDLSKACPDLYRIEERDV